jgi:hypothetical protein
VIQDPVFKANDKSAAKLNQRLNDPNSVTSAVYGEDALATSFLKDIRNKLVNDSIFANERLRGRTVNPELQRLRRFILEFRA